jgi:Uma2 family endonuclease
MLQPRKRYFSHQEYFEIEKHGEFKNEYYNGELFAMSGASHNHNVIAVNVTSALHRALYDKNCFVYAGDMKIEIDPGKHYAYPDVSVVCGDVKFAAGRRDVITNPLVIVEVLSESTADYDRGDKFRAYREIKSFQDYILIDQYSCAVEYFWKNKAGQWRPEEFRQMNESFIIRSLDVKLSLKEIYYRIEL